MERRNVGEKKRAVRLHATCTYAGNKRFSKSSTAFGTEAKHRERNANKCRCGAVIFAIPCGKPGTLSFSLRVEARKLMRSWTIPGSPSVPIDVDNANHRTKSVSAPSTSTSSSISESEDPGPGFVIITKCITRHTNHQPRQAVGNTKVLQLASSVEAVQETRVSSTLETFIAI